MEPRTDLDGIHSMFDVNNCLKNSLDKNANENLSIFAIVSFKRMKLTKLEYIPAFVCHVTADAKMQIIIKTKLEKVQIYPDTFCL